MSKVLGFRSSIQVSALPSPAQDLQGMLVNYNSEPYWCNGSAWVKVASKSLPFFKSDGTESDITLAAGSYLPFYTADGTSANISMGA